MSRFRKVHPRKTERGGVACEFALLGSLLILFFVVVVDLGFLIWEYEILQNAAGVGARHSALPEHEIARSLFGTDEMRRVIKQRVIDYLAEEGIKVPESAIAIDQEHPIDFAFGEGTNRRIYGSEVKITYVRPLLLGTAYLDFTSVTLGARSVFANFY